MEELTIEEMIRYTVRIQQDSFLFYRKAARLLEGNELKALADALADDKVHHLRELKNLLNECIMNGDDLNEMVDVDTTMFDEILDKSTIPVQATPADVMCLSYVREKITKQAYEMILKLPMLHEKVARVFSTLIKLQEQQVRDISTKI
jgi:rubrerythrin